MNLKMILQNQNMTQRLLRALPFFLPLYVLRFRLGSLPTTALEIFLLALVAVFTLERGAAGWREGWRRLGRWRAPLVAWLVAGLVAVFVSPVPLAGLGLWRAYFLEPLLVFWIMAALALDDQDKKEIARTFSLTLFILALWAVFQFLTGLDIPKPWNVSIADGRRAVGPFSFPNALSLFAALLGAWLFARWMNDRREQASLLGWVSALAMILAAKSIGGFIGLSFAIFVVLLANKAARKFVLAAAIVLGLLVTAVPQVRTPVVRAVTFQEWSGRVRLYMWRDTWRMLKDRPILGAGLGGYKKVFKPYQRTKGIEVFQYPHNIFLNLWSETGLLGIFVFIWIVATWIVSCQSQMSNVKCQMFRLAPILALLLHGLVDVPYFKNDLAIIFWMLIALTISYDERRIVERV